MDDKISDMDKLKASLDKLNEILKKYKQDAADRDLERRIAEADRPYSTKQIEKQRLNLERTRGLMDKIVIGPDHIADVLIFKRRLALATVK